MLVMSYNFVTEKLIQYGRTSRKGKWRINIHIKGHTKGGDVFQHSVIITHKGDINDAKSVAVENIMNSVAPLSEEEIQQLELEGTEYSPSNDPDYITEGGFEIFKL